MKSSSSEASRADSAKNRPPPVDAVEKRTRRTFVEAASDLGRALVGGTRGGGAPAKGGRVPAASSAAASIHRLRDVLERDRAITATIGFDDEELPSAAAPTRNERAGAHRGHVGEQAKVCEQCGAGEASATPARTPAGTPAAAKRSGTAGSSHSERRDATQKESTSLRVPPPPRRVAALDSVPNACDEDEALSVHDEPTKVGPPPKRMKPVDERASALAAAAASAFGSSTHEG